MGGLHNKRRKVLSTGSISSSRRREGVTKGIQDVAEDMTYSYHVQVTPHPISFLIELILSFQSSPRLSRRMKRLFSMGTETARETMRENGGHTAVTEVAYLSAACTAPPVVLAVDDSRLGGLSLSQLGWGVYGVRGRESGAGGNG